MPSRTVILGTGSALPARRVGSRELERDWGLPSGWIARRTGILERPLAAEDEAVSDLAVRAAEAALRAAGVERSKISLLLLATSTPDHLLPPTAPLVAHRLNLTSAGALDLTGACAGFLYALALADGWSRTRDAPVLVVAANVLSRRVNPGDPHTASIFADGAGAVLLDQAEDDRLGIRACHLTADGAHYDAIAIPAGGSRVPLNKTMVEENLHLMRINDGPRLFRQAVQGMVAAGQAALRESGLGIEQIDWWIPHQAGARIIAEAGRRLGVPMERTVSIVERCGNSSAAGIPTALALAVEDGRVRPGQTLLLTAAGAGMMCAAVVVKY